MRVILSLNVTQFFCTARMAPLEQSIDPAPSKSATTAYNWKESIEMPMSVPSEITVTIKLFAVYQEAFGTEEISRRVPANTTVGAILDLLTIDRPELARWHDITQFGVNLDFVSPDTLLRDGDEVVLIPPVSGG